MWSSTKVYPNLHTRTIAQDNVGYLTGDSLYFLDLHYKLLKLLPLKIS